MTPKTSITWYVARNHLGEFSCGRSWVNNIQQARIFRKKGPVSMSVTQWVKNNPSSPVPQILMWESSLEDAQVVDVTEVTQKRVKKLGQKKLKRELAYNQRRLDYLRQDADKIKAEMAKLEGKT